MALRIVKLFVAASTTTSVSTHPTVSRFFHEVASQVSAGETLIIAVDQFETDSGVAAVSLPLLAADNSYVRVYVNGVPVMHDLITYTPGEEGSLAIQVPEGSEPIEATSPVVLEVVNYEPTSTSSTSVTT